MKTFKIVVLGNSVALRNRPIVKRPDNKNYGLLLVDMFRRNKIAIEVENHAFQRATTQDILNNINDYISTFPDVYIFNLGVCDAPTREIPYWYAEIINRRRNGFLKKLLTFFRNKIILPNRTLFVRLRGKKQWISKKRFEENYRTILSTLTKDTNASFILLSINLANKRIEEILPRSGKNYIEYNMVIASLAEEFDAVYLNLDDLDSETHYPDGTHFSLEGNTEVAKRLMKILQSRNDVLSKNG